MMLETTQLLANTYKSAIDRLINHLDQRFDNAVDMMLQSTGQVIVCGMGKSGLFGQKISSTLASTGTPSIFLHPAEALHGDLGRVRSNDVLLLISNSGETEEIIRLLPAFERIGIASIAFTGNMNSSLARHCRVVLDISVDREACPLNLAPTTSGLTTLVMGDALAYVSWLLIFSAVFYTPAILALRGPSVLPRGGAQIALGLLAGFASFIAYALVVWAMTKAPIALVTALRESSILFAMLLGWLFFRDTMGPTKILAGLVIVAGVILTRL